MFSKSDSFLHRPGWVILAALIFSLGLTAQVRAENRVLKFNWPSQRDPNTVLKEIVLTDNQIIITMQHRNLGLRPSHPRLYPPGHALSFYIREKGTGKRHYLAASQGLAVEPDYNIVPFGQSRTFKLFFPRIPLTSFELLEGEPSLRSAVKNAIFWDFLNIDLPKLEKDFKIMDRPPPQPDHIWSRPEPPAAKPAAQPAPKEPAKPKQSPKEMNKAKPNKQNQEKQDWKIFTDSNE